MPVMKLIFSKYPKLLERIKNRHNDYNQTTLYVNEKEKAGEIFVIRPDTKLPINRTEKDPEILKQVYNIGRQTAEKQLDKLKEYLN